MPGNHETADRLRQTWLAELRAAPSPGLAPIIDGLNAPGFSANTPPPDPVAALGAGEHLSTALSAIGCAAALADAVRDALPHRRWYRILDGAPVDTALERGLVAAQVGVDTATDTRMGMFLLGPGLHYPLHTHAALEVYYVVSGTLTLRHGRAGTPFRIGPGEHSVTPNHRPHSLTTGDHPCLIVYAWRGPVTEPIWWWEEAEGDWRRTRWDREVNGRWVRSAAEPLTEAVIREAGEP